VSPVFAAVQARIVRNVAVLIPSTVRPFELAVYAEVFGLDRTADGVPAFDYAVVSERPGVPVPLPGGLTITPTRGLDRLATADLIAVASPPSPAAGPSLVPAVRRELDRGARVILASGHFPVRDNPARFVDEDPIFTSAGTSATIDLCLHLVAKDHGAAVAATIARSMLITPPHAPALARPDDDIASLLDWAIGNLHEDLSIEVMARQALLSRRSLARRFRAATGTTPYAWVLEQRVRLAQQLLEREPALGVEEAAGRAGFSSAALLRQHFQRRFGCSPTQYRARFAPLSRG
jgi:AraC family transcriptional regulator, transcriptional activator FtrA